jgi:D-glycero-alpha-D-manno-heptose-7-phosphate kinase
MIITRTPFRVSFVGGGTDLKDFYTVEAGAVISTAIKKYMYITVNRRFDNTIRVSYTKTEIVSRVEDIQHPIVREALMLVGIDGGIEIVSIADIPSGTGLGSSSSFTVGLLNALYAYTGVLKSADELAEQACKIEIDLLAEPIGKQDQYIAAHGGLCHIQFNPDGTVFVNPIVMKNGSKQALEQKLLLFYSGISRDAAVILREQKSRTGRGDTLQHLSRLVALTLETHRCFLNGLDINELAGLLHRGWLLKKELAGGISNLAVDKYYAKALAAGALGGKLLGAGGGGFLLLVCPPEKQPAVRLALGELQEISFFFEPEGSKIIYVV